VSSILAIKAEVAKRKVWSGLVWSGLILLVWSGLYGLFIGLVSIFLFFFHYFFLSKQLYRLLNNNCP